MVQSGLLGNDGANIPRVNEMNWIVIYKIKICYQEKFFCVVMTSLFVVFFKRG